MKRYSILDHKFKEKTMANELPLEGTYAYDWETHQHLEYDFGWGSWEIMEV